MSGYQGSRNRGYARTANRPIGIRKKTIKNENRSADPDAQVEQGSRHESDGTIPAQKINLPVYIHFHIKLHRLYDPDGACCKYALDGLVKAGLLSDDSAKYVKAVTHTQEKVDQSEPEMTIIYIKVVKDAKV